MLLAIDVGNTQTVFGLFEGPNLSDKHVVIDGWEGPKAARKAIEEAAAKYIRRGES